MSMAAGGAGGNGAGRRRRRRSRAIMSEINVTPLVDVMLVLLIVFMVAAPMLTVGVPLELPQTQARQLEAQQQPITLSVTTEGEIFLGEEAVALEDVVARVGALAVNGTEDRIFVRGAASANYGTVMQVMGALSGAGYSKIGLVTEQQQSR